MILKEVWEYPGYWCDPEGNIYTTKPKNGRGIKSGPLRLLKTNKTTRGYLKVMLYKNGKGIDCLVHRLILKTFNHLLIPGLEVNHKNGIKTDNRLENLEWTTRTENERHARLVLGKDLKGEKHILSKIRASWVPEIKRLRSEGKTLSSIAKQYGVGISTVHRIVKGLAWTHVG